ncbi:hypothetical protein M3Y98_00117000 [Aphelenchoides besseyi]|nr:hypothetical protein M3Y98_00117000 [Aphelenchoides besseyi]KAI6199467.1 hypothetical protein M3Y96_00630300 [Aphelenchoides besseyi]
MMRSLTIFFVVFGVATALNCYQGQQNANISISGSAATCPSPSYSCLKTYDNNTGLVTRACQTTNCTQNGIVNPSGFCQNMSSSQSGYLQQSIYCCCYGDGCNGAAAHSSLLLRFGWLAVPALAYFSYQQSK